MASASEMEKMIEALEAPAPSGLFREVRGFFELPRLVLNLPWLARLPHGHGEPVLVLPGYHVGDLTTVLLRNYLRFLGYRVRGIGSKKNLDVPEMLVRVLRRLASQHRSTGQPVQIVGWSLGGYLAREAARERPDLVSQIITLGTPVIGGPKYTVVVHAMRRRGLDIDAMAAEVALRNQTALTTPVTAIYSRRDAVVAWEACIDRDCANVEHVEVATTHVGLGFSAAVYRIIAERLARGAELSHQP
ncbi:MAG TPA: alpha/beta fold hydrolase [Candidatus Binatia bacterium]|jgi:alpha-beta hydrolase superfamily lysophospholipase